ncbi:hypothetical protein SLE2022_403670 [Rubroshorea leprosula]
MRDFCWIRSFALTEAFGPRKKDFKPSRKQAREKQAKYKLCQKQDEEAELSYKRRVSAENGIVFVPKVPIQTKTTPKWKGRYRS